VHRPRQPAGSAARAGVFWLHIGAFAFYNGLIGYLLIRGESGSLVSVSLYCVAMELHLLVNDFALQHDHRNLFRLRGRWPLTAMPLVG